MVGDGAFLAGERLIVAGDASPDGEPHVICERKDILLRGEHNVLNVLAACAIAGAAGVEPEAMAAAIREFHGVAHRLETVRVIDGVTYVNDSIATAPERVQAALKSYEEPLVLLEIDTDLLGVPVVEEPPAPDVEETFPHIYGPLDPSAVVRVTALTR